MASSAWKMRSNPTRSETTLKFRKCLTDFIKSSSLKSFAKCVTPSRGTLAVRRALSYLTLHGYARWASLFPGIQSVYLRGSFANGTAVPGASDIDFFILPYESATKRTLKLFNRVHTIICKFIPLLDPRCQATPLPIWRQQLADFDYLRARFLIDELDFKHVAGERASLVHASRCQRSADLDGRAISALLRSIWRRFFEIRAEESQTPREILSFESAKLILQCERAHDLLTHQSTDAPSRSHRLHDLLRAARKMDSPIAHFHPQLIDAIDRVQKALRDHEPKALGETPFKTSSSRPLHCHLDQRVLYTLDSPLTLGSDSRSTLLYRVGVGYFLLLNPENAVDEEQLILDRFTDPLAATWAEPAWIQSLQKNQPRDLCLSTPDRDRLHAKCLKELATFRKGLLLTRALEQTESQRFRRLFWKAAQFKLIVQTLNSRTEEVLPMDFEAVLASLRHLDQAPPWTTELLEVERSLSIRLKSQASGWLMTFMASESLEPSPQPSDA